MDIRRAGNPRVAPILLVTLVAACGSVAPSPTVMRESAGTSSAGPSAAATATAPATSPSPSTAASSALPSVAPSALSSPSASVAASSALPSVSPSPSASVVASGSAGGSPAPRAGAQLVWDRVRQLVVLLNGDNADRIVWGWDGVAWQIVDRNGPEPRSLGGTVYDRDRDELVIYGGNTAAGCEPKLVIGTHGLGWATSQADPPTACDHLAMTEAPAGGDPTVVLFGGQTVPSDGRRPLDETWIWEGGGWFRQDVVGPSARIHHTMAFDPVRNIAVLFGGRSGGTDVGDTWEWNGTAWRQVATSGPAPSAREGVRMTWDPTTKSVLLFGGAAGLGASEGDTWSWDGKTWKRLGTDGPPAREHHAMAADLTRGRVVLFGGSSGNDVFGDTWEWDGSAWTCVADCP